MERCPNCRARGEDTTTCRRCGMDLANLTAVEQAAERLTALGIAHLASGDPTAAKDDLTQALDLHRTPFAERLLGFAEALAIPGRRPVPDTIRQEPRAVTTTVPDTSPPDIGEQNWATEW